MDLNFITQAINYITTNYETILQVGAYVVAIASFIVRFTPTVVDNELLDKFQGFLNWLAANKPRPSKATRMQLAKMEKDSN